MVAVSSGLLSQHEKIDTTFDFRSDTPPGGDPDELSPSLRRYHKLLWSKRLASGVFFELDDTKRGVYLYHRSQVGEFFLSSDGAIPSFRKEKCLTHVFDQISLEERETFQRLAYTIGGMMLFPGNRVDRKMTINGARGFHPSIKDRFDLTVECIRRHYCNEHSPLSDTLERYATFFGLFENFRGYVEYFLLQDLVTEDSSAVRFFMPFANFTTSPVPASLDAYKAYCQSAAGFIDARSRRILQSC